MLLMLKLLATTLLLNSVLVAGDNELIKEFLEKSFKNNAGIVALDVKIIDRVKVDSMKDWDAVIISVDATVKAKPKNRQVKQKMIWFTSGDIITKDLIDMETGDSLKDSVTPTFQPIHYKKENLIYGNADAKHKVAIFSDPLCPFCRIFVPSAINYMKKQPDKFAIYYYHLPLPNLHPAAVELSQAAVAAELKGYKDVVLNMYKVKVNSREKDVEKILTAFNKVVKSDIKAEEIKTKEVLSHYKSDLAISEDLMVQGTPTMFFDGKIDKTKQKYKKVK
ncbi:MAG: thioredoxin domain-containing protein [Sulfurimonas sp.]|nr:thioredoxin domain-containing protein [Sulfurimonas sp.]